MKTSVRQVSLTRSYVAYLSTASFLSANLRESLAGIQWISPSNGKIDFSIAVAEQFRAALTEHLAKVGFDEEYEPNEEGRVLEDLIDRFEGSWLD
jgi:hypothetical protein